MFLYGYGNFRFLIRNFYPRAVFTAIKSQVETHEDAVLVQITEGSSRQVVPVFGHPSSIPDTISVPLENGFLKLAYGAMPVTIPFSVHLKKFQLERYPGSDSPSSFASDVVLVDSNAGLEKEFRIFMNNTLNYKGFKFFQSSYDTDEKGTVLSVSHDFWGTSITYLGYALMILGMVLSMVLSKPNSWQISAETDRGPSGSVTSEILCRLRNSIRKRRLNSHPSLYSCDFTK